MNRRTFLADSSMIAAGTWLVPSFLKPLEQQLNSSNDRILVVVQLSGGNDGLNTIVPYENDLYYNNRPKIAIPKSEVLPLSDQLGLNPALQPLKDLYDKGWMTILNGVGYPNPDRSHFRSMDIWHTGSGSSEFLSTGWLGRYLDSACTGCQNPYQAIEVDANLSLALKGNMRSGMAIDDPASLYRLTHEKFFDDLTRATSPAMLSDDNLGYLYKTLINTHSSADYVYEKTKIQPHQATYPQTSFAQQLKTVARYIFAGLSTRVYYVSLGGFDTHFAQSNRHPKLLETYAQAVNVFLNDLNTNGHLDRVLVMTFSEFGRRVAQNASGGTDHGTANNLFLMGGSLRKKGMYNPLPSLADLDEGDLKYAIDFRNVYATVLSRWLGENHSAILNGTFEMLPIV